MKGRKIIVIMLAVIAALATLYVIAPGFLRQGNAVIGSYRVSDDGKQMTIHVGVATSIGYVRKVSQHQRDGVVYLDCYGAFGGINSSWGAKNEYTLQLDKSAEKIAIFRGDNRYDIVLQKDEDGQWQRVKVG